jgi:DNA polymerase (family 10)
MAKPCEHGGRRCSRPRTEGIVGFVAPPFKPYLLRMPINRDLIVIFQQMADIMELLGEDRFRVNAYARVARAIEAMTVDLSTIGADAKAVCGIEGIGKSSADKICEYINTGQIQAHQVLVEKVPPGILPLMNIGGLGPKTIALLWREGGVDCLETLKQKLQTDELAGLPRMGAKKLESLRKAVAFAQTAGGRVRIGKALPLAQWFVDQLRGMPGVLRAEFAGSLRRGRETIGDIDLLVASEEKDAAAISDAFAGLGVVAEVLARGATKTSIRTSGGIQCDLRVVRPASFGAALMYFTGSKEHNVAMRERAIKRGCSLNEYGLTKKDGTLVAGATEEEVFKALGLAWVPPELREDHGELAQAEKNALPQLVTVEDIRAELHAHTIASDGAWTISELAEAAIARGFHTVAVTDHSKGQAQANGLNEARLERHIVDVRAAAAAMNGRIRILAGTEVDILADGRLDYPDSLLKELDIVVASPHAALTQEPEKATARLLRAIENPYVTIIGHPTGRMVNRREGLSPDMAQIIDAAARRGIALEINANHYRLDLRDTHARAALERGVKLAIDTDAHGESDLGELRYGVLTARRAGATAGDVVNCLSRDALDKWIRSTRG